MKRAAALFAAVLLAGAAAPALAEPPPAPDRPLTDPTQEARARALFGDIRCVVCQHESIADSPAGIAADLRGLVREQIAAGKTDDEIKADLLRRYGDYVLFQPPLRIGTWLLWFGPFALAAGAGVVLVLRARRRSAGEAAPLTPEEERALAALTADDENA
ncbi:MAG: cytochrome c-type biogenesis protein CcmH [Brevundimonas diminuta]|uniref:cytochrome c-type biogenesis protein n=1 Tax=Brevundimonas diminuta TaxID=293 RepID=UPI0019A58125|nr:cytochrome c-type biogenesis protein [Brevundimonas diminuta]MBD3817592.1 cytochrome c-type biogenesis protein CcmH [Brevundimonas diminuta]MBI2249591.1 cytochrome c-type biogenesis protein CcmH [Brevundimonas diminuta]